MTAPAEDLPEGTSPHPVLVFCPYLQLQSSYEFGDWWIGPLDSYGGTWNPPDLADAAEQLLARFVDVSGKQIERPSLVATRDGVTGEPPPNIEALGLAIAFSAVAQNPHAPLEEYDRQSWRTITTDNSDLWVQPIDIEGRWIALERGFWVHALSGGHRFDDAEFIVPAPLELHVHGHSNFDAELAAAVYSIVDSPEQTADEQLARRLKQAIRWWLQSWRNSPSLAWADRIIQLRVAIDALVGSNKTNDAAVWLDALFGGLSDDARGDELLWNSTDQLFQRSFRGELNDLPAFEHWFRSFADRRNEIVHEGEATTQKYSEKASPFNGDYLVIAERVVLEAVLVSLHDLIPGFYWRSSLWRALAGGLEEIDFEATDGSKPNDVGKSSP